MKKLICSLFVLSVMTHLIAQQMTCDDIDKIIQLEERSWNENHDLLDPDLFTDDYRIFTGDVLSYEKYAGRAADMQRTHDQIDNFKFEILDHFCTDLRVVTFWKTTGTHRQFMIPVKIFGMTISKTKNGQAYEAISIHDMLPSLQAAGFIISPPKSTK
ncbi:MAG: hypothetical protein IPL46_18325 [Saprospiraceae bacterium]|nr:hypothetical protein [Saprospiraceae bacterium]